MAKLFTKETKNALGNVATISDTTYTYSAFANPMSLGLLLHERLF